MNKTYASLQKQIADLTRQADELRSKEAAEVVARIREAIEHYGITPEELFGASKARAAKRPARTPAKKSGSSPKYRDNLGNVWGGRGPRPAWFREALASGKSAADFLVKP